MNTEFENILNFIQKYDNLKREADKPPTISFGQFLDIFLVVIFVAFLLFQLLEHASSFVKNSGSCIKKFWRSIFSDNDNVVVTEQEKKLEQIENIIINMDQNIANYQKSMEESLSTMSNQLDELRLKPIDSDALKQNEEVNQISEDTESTDFFLSVPNSERDDLLHAEMKKYNLTYNIHLSYVALHHHPKILKRIEDDYKIMEAYWLNNDDNFIPSQMEIAVFMFLYHNIIYENNGKLFQKYLPLDKHNEFRMQVTCNNQKSSSKNDADAYYNYLVLCFGEIQKLRKEVKDKKLKVEIKPPKPNPKW